MTVWEARRLMPLPGTPRLRATVHKLRCVRSDVIARIPAFHGDTGITKSTVMDHQSTMKKQHTVALCCINDTAEIAGNTGLKRAQIYRAKNMVPCVNSPRQAFQRPVGSVLPTGIYEPVS